MPRPFLPIGLNAIAVLTQFSSQGFPGRFLPTLKRKPKVGEFAFWWLNRAFLGSFSTVG